MHRLLLAATAAAALVAAFGSVSPAAAAGDSSRYCLQGTTWGYPGNCQFSTYEQCQATASGTDAGCGINPVSAFADQRNGYRGNDRKYSR